MYCDKDRLIASMPNNFFDTTSLVDEAQLLDYCKLIAGRMDTKFLSHGHETPLTDDYIDDLLDWPTRGGGGAAPGDKIMESVVLANIYGTRQLVYSAIATSDEEESQLSEMNGQLFMDTMNEIIEALSPRNTGIGPVGINTRGRQPIIKIKDEALW